MFWYSFINFSCVQWLISFMQSSSMEQGSLLGGSGRSHQSFSLLCCHFCCNWVVNILASHTFIYIQQKSIQNRHQAFYYTLFHSLKKSSIIYLHHKNVTSFTQQLVSFLYSFFFVVAEIFLILLIVFSMLFLIHPTPLDSHLILI